MSPVDVEKGLPLSSRRWPALVQNFTEQGTDVGISNRNIRKGGRERKGIKMYLYPHKQMKRQAFFACFHSDIPSLCKQAKYRQM